MRKLLKRYLPDHSAVHGNRWLAMFGSTLLHPRLWHLNRHSAAGAVAVGLFCGLIPGPFQMLGAAICCIVLRVNLPLALLTTLYTNPFTIVPLYFVAYSMGAWVLGSTLYQVLVLGLPRAEIMGGIGILALAANLASVLLLMRYKDGDANVRSVWLCSRNDAIGNVVVMAAAIAVWWTASAWPDLIVAGLMAGLFLTSAVQILRQAWAEYRSTGPGAPVPAE